MIHKGYKSPLQQRNLENQSTIKNLQSGLFRGQKIWSSMLNLNNQTAFCWSKIGPNAGEGINQILRRKELERQAGNGLFMWGIGNSIKQAVNEARKKNQELEVLFTSMISKGQKKDIEPKETYLWLKYINEIKAPCTLPDHILITSRGAPKIIRQYALFLMNREPLTNVLPSEEAFGLDEVVNYCSKKTPASSQVTSVVQYQPSRNPTKQYKLIFRAKLLNTEPVQLSDPFLLKGSLLEAYNQIQAINSVEDWLEAVINLKALCRKGH